MYLQFGTQSNMGKWTHSNKKGDAIVFDVNAFQKALMHFYYIDKFSLRYRGNSSIRFRFR